MSEPDLSGNEGGNNQETGKSEPREYVLQITTSFLSAFCLHGLICPSSFHLPCVPGALQKQVEVATLNLF